METQTVTITLHILTNYKLFYHHTDIVKRKHPQRNFACFSAVKYCQKYSILEQAISSLQPEGHYICAGGRLYRLWSTGMKELLWKDKFSEA